MYVNDIVLHLYHSWNKWLLLKCTGARTFLYLSLSHSHRLQTLSLKESGIGVDRHLRASAVKRQQ